MISAMLQISLPIVLCWRIVPLTSSEIDVAGVTSHSAARRIGLIGAEWSKPLPMSQGRPSFLASPCRSRRVMSRPTA